MNLFRKSLLKRQSKAEAKQKLAYFISFWSQHKILSDSLLKDHEPDEVKAQLQVSSEMLQSRAYISMYARNSKLEIDKWPEEVRFRKLIDAISYARQHAQFNKTEVLELHFLAYGKPSNIEELMLKASLSGDKALYSFLKKCI